MITLHIEASHQWMNLARIAGFQMIVAAMGGTFVLATIQPTADEDWWQVDMTVMVPAERRARCEAIAEKMFDGQVKTTMTVSNNEPKV